LHCSECVLSALRFATKHDTPAAFLRQKETKRLIESIKKQCVNSHTEPVSTINGGKLRGSFGHRYILLAYAAWLNGDVYLQAMIALDSMSAGNAGNQLSASEKYFRAERLFNEVVALAHGAIDAQSAQVIASSLALGGVGAVPRELMRALEGQ
jgi:hypothetical protein